MTELATIKSPRTRLEREAEAWNKAAKGLSGTELWLLELLRHGRTERIEEVIAAAEAGKEELEPPKRSFVHWRSRGFLDHDIATAGAEMIEQDLADIRFSEHTVETPAPLKAEEWPTYRNQPVERDLSEYPHLERLFG